MKLVDKIIKAAKEYRKFGWNVIPLCDYSKSPSSSPFIRQRGWKEFEERTLTEDEFTSAFSVPNLTGVGFITGAISRTVVLDEDSYKAGGMSVNLQSGMISQTANGGRHIFGKYVNPVRSMGFRKGVNVEGKGDGGFIVLPPSQVYRKDKEGKLSKEKGEYTWLVRCEWEMLPVITNKELAQFKPKVSEHLRLRDFTRAPLGQQHNSLRTFALMTFNRFKPEEWEVAEQHVRVAAGEYSPPHPEWRVSNIIRDAKEYILAHPKEMFLDNLKEEARRTDPVDYSQMSDEELEEIEQREELSTGLKLIDNVVPWKTGFYVICANPGAGKGWFATWLIKQFFLIHQKRSVFFSLEMSEPLVRTRILQQWSGLTEEQLTAGNDTVIAKSIMKQDAVLVYPFGQDDAGYQTPENFQKDIIEFYEKGYRVFLFDHLHELDGANDNAQNQKVTGEWSKVFQSICKVYKDIWLIIFAQPNGAAAKKHILTRTDIAGSKSITQRCEVFISLNRMILSEAEEAGRPKGQSQDRSVYLWVDKNRLSSHQKEGDIVYLSATGNFTQFPDGDILLKESSKEASAQMLLPEEKKEPN